MRPSPERIESGAILFLAAAGVVLVALMAFFTERAWGGEERTLLNIPYTFLHYNKVAFPAYDYWYRGSYDRLFVHPPTHYLAVGILLKLGLSLYYAEAVPLAVFTILCLLIIVTGGFSTEMQLGLLAGVLSGIGWIATVGAGDYAFHLRPDAHMAMALLAGLLMLESARVREWDNKRLFAGALLLVYGSTIHYPGTPAWLGVFVYLFLAWRELGWRRVRTRLLIVILGECVAGVPYLLWHVIRNGRYIALVLSAQTKKTEAQIVLDNFPIYHSLQGAAGTIFSGQLFYAFPLKGALELSIPPFILAAALLAWRKQTAALILAALPVPISCFFLFGRKLFAYYYLEFLLVLIGFWLLVSWLWMSLASKTRYRWGKPVGAAAFAVLVTTAVALATPPLRSVELRPHIHELDLDRAAAEQVVGPGATVASVHNLWQLGGGANWFDLTNSLLFQPPPMDVATFFSKFDAIAVPDRGFFGTTTGLNEASLYEKRFVRLRGFGESGVTPNIKWIWFAARADRPVRGFFWRAGALWEFQQADAGDHVVATTIVPLSVSQLDPFAREASALDYWAAELPSKKIQDADAFAMVMLLDAETFNHMGSTVFAKYPPIEIIRGTVAPADSGALLRQMEERHEVITFPRSNAELLSLLTKPSFPADVRKVTVLDATGPQYSVEAADGETGAWRVRGRSVSNHWLASTDLPRLTKDAWYQVSFDLDIHSGGAAVIVVQNDQTPLGEIDHEVPEHGPEKFAFRFPGAPPPSLIVSAWNPAGPRDVDLTIRNLIITRVDMIR